MTAADPWSAATAAKLPATGLATLASVRAEPGVRVFEETDGVWVTWPADRPGVARALASVFGGQLFRHRDGVWFPIPSRLPTSAAPPTGEGRPLPGVLFPAKFHAAPPGEPLPPVPLRLVRGGPVLPATALWCRVAELKIWADTATTDELAAATAAVMGDRILVRGQLPATAAGERFSGSDVLLPLGFVTQPLLPSAVIRAAAGASKDELLLLTATAAATIPRTAFGPVTRAGLRAAGAT